MIETAEVTLPGGIALDGGWSRTARLRPLRGWDEEFLAEAGHSLLPAERTTALLARCLDAIGPVAPVTAATVRALTVGDREALLLHLRRLMLGERIACVLTCPMPGCGEALDLDLRVGDLLVPPDRKSTRLNSSH